MGLTGQKIISNCIFLGLILGSGVLIHKYILHGFVIALWMVPLSFIPIFYFHLASLVVSGCFAVSLGFLGKKWLKNKFFSRNVESSKIWRGMFQGSVFLLSFFGSLIFFWNLLALILAILLLWFAQRRIWQFIGFLSVGWNTVVQYYIYFVYL